MDGRQMDFTNFRIKDAFNRLAAGEKRNSISFSTHLQADVISFLQLQQMALCAAAHADLSRFNPSFCFDRSYIAVVSRHFHGFPPSVMERLLHCQHPHQFAEAFAFALFYWIRVSTPPTVRLNFCQFVLDCVQLSHGQTLTFSIAGMLRDIGVRFAFTEFFRYHGTEIMILSDVLDALYMKTCQLQVELQINLPHVELAIDGGLIVDIPEADHPPEEDGEPEARRPRDSRNLSFASGRWRPLGETTERIRDKGLAVTEHFRDGARCFS
jgi:hypothetical protein